jgi:hypothetical protein
MAVKATNQGHGCGVTELLICKCYKPVVIPLL